jgi:hypothetical protein
MRLLKMRGFKRVLHLREIAIRVPAEHRTAVGDTIDLGRDGSKVFTGPPVSTACKRFL